MLLEEGVHSTSTVANTPRSSRMSSRGKIGTTDTHLAYQIWSQGRGHEGVDKFADMTENWRFCRAVLVVHARLEVLPSRVAVMLAVVVLVLTLTTMTMTQSDRTGGS